MIGYAEDGRHVATFRVRRYGLNWHVEGDGGCSGVAADGRPLGP